MNTQLAFVFGVVPALVAIWLFDRMDRKRPEPPKTRRLVALMGGVAVLPAALLEEQLFKVLGPMDPYKRALIISFVFVAAVEELAKYAAMRIYAWERPEFDERMDGIVYAARAGLGFALVENVFYLLSVRDHLQTLLIVAAIRAFVSVPGHALWSGMVGYFAARRRFDGTGIGVVGGYLLAVAMHGAFDAALLCGMLEYAQGHHATTYALLCVPLVLVIGGVIAIRVFARRAVTADDADVRLANPPAIIA